MDTLPSAQKESPQLPLNLPSWPDKAQACPISSIPSLAQDRPCPACPGLLGWGRACSQCQLPAQHRAGCPMLLAAAPACRWPHPPLPGLPATSASGPQPGFHLACYCRRWAGRLTPRAGSQEKGPTGKTLGKRNRPSAASHHHHPLSLLLQIDLWVELRLSRRCPLTHRHLCANTASQACRHNQPLEPHILSPARKATHSQPVTPSAPTPPDTANPPHTQGSMQSP